MRIFLNIFMCISFSLLLFSCNKNSNISTKNNKKFIQLSSDKTNVSFENKLTENDSMNYFKYGYMYLGGGVAVGDINNDGLDDIYFAGNMVENKLYLNSGNLTFKDITNQAKVMAGNQWCTGVTMADVNGDGLLDIYLSISGIWTSTKNLLYVNQGINKSGVPSFKESAEKYGLADQGNSIQATFFDYDNDNDLDVYVINYPVTSYRTTPKQYDKKMREVTDLESNTLYRNNGDNTFTDVTDEAGLKSFGLSLAAAVGDYNNDGFMDIYVSNDFATPDNFYFNNGNGTFTDQIKKTVNQASFFGMGTDACDFNNDGLLDFFQLDMSTNDNRRSKANMQSMNIGLFQMMNKFNFHTQYMENSLQLNNGNTKDNLPHFSNISRLAGISKTDWSWASLFADLDNDGFKDLYITNGTRKEVNNKDYLNDINKKHKGNINEINLVKLINEMPSEKIENFSYKNNGDLTFEDLSDEWGLNFKGFSNGLAYSDLDNDGDIDLVVNNLDSESFIYKNNSIENYEATNFLEVTFKGPSKNKLGIGVKTHLFYNKDLQYQELILTRGFQSSVPPRLFFGLGNTTTLDSIQVEWPDGKTQLLKNVKTNQKLTLNYSHAKENLIKLKKKPPLFRNITSSLGVNHQHQENYFDDYYYQILLPNKMSQFGPSLAVADINNDGLDDFFIGGASQKLGSIYKQQPDGSFMKKQTNTTWEKDKAKEDVGATFFDANNDGYQDLFVVSGGNEYYKNSRPYQDRLYINDGYGNLIKNEKALPKNFISGSRVIAADYDNDGDLDLFVGGRHTPRNYPLPTSSTILRNDSSASEILFTDITKEVAPDLHNIGMVTDAVFTDFNDDNMLDLVVVGEWMEPTFFLNVNNKLEKQTNLLGLDKNTGWWNSIIAKDFDNDGDIDFVVGNLGLNYKYKASKEETFDIYAADFDNNKSLDIVLGYYYQGEQYPLRGRQCSSQQIPAINVKFKDYNSFANADLADIYSKQSLKNALHYKAHTFASSYIENLGNNNFRVKPLPNEAQFSSINTLLSKDINNDGFLDLIIAGNLYPSEVETPRNDASYGLCLLGDGKGNFNPIPNSNSGLYVVGDVKNASWIKLVGGKTAIIFAKNNDKLQIELVLKKEKD